MSVKASAQCMVVVSLLALGGLPAFGQGAPLDKVYACAGVADAGQRLACYDAAVAGLKHAQSGGDVAVISREQIQKAEKESFGLSAPSLASVTAQPKDEKLRSPDTVTLAIREVSEGADGRYRFVMENGQVWKQTDETTLSGMSQKNLTAEIRKAALGTFMMKIGNRSAIRVKRVE